MTCCCIVMTCGKYDYVCMASCAIIVLIYIQIQKWEQECKRVSICDVRMCPACPKNYYMYSKVKKKFRPYICTPKIFKKSHGIFCFFWPSICTARKNKTVQQGFSNKINFIFSFYFLCLIQYIQQRCPKT